MHLSTHWLFTERIYIFFEKHIQRLLYRKIGGTKKQTNSNFINIDNFFDYTKTFSFTSPFFLPRTSPWPLFSLDFLHVIHNSPHSFQFIYFLLFSFNLFYEQWTSLLKNVNNIIIFGSYQSFINDLDLKLLST